jgi:hypothetical protein
MPVLSLYYADLNKRSEWPESLKRIVPASVKEVSPVSVTSDSNEAFAPGAGWLDGIFIAPIDAI